MTNAELNTALYQKMFAEQETYREWLLSQPADGHREEVQHQVQARGCPRPEGCRRPAGSGCTDGVKTQNSRTSCRNLQSCNQPE